MNSRRSSSFIAWSSFLIFSWFVEIGNSRDVNGSQLVQLSDCTCLGGTQTFECTVFGAGVTVWNSIFFDCQDGRTEIHLRHSRYDNVDSPLHADCNRGAVIAKSIGVFDNCYTSQLIVTIGEEMVNKTIECSIQNEVDEGSTRVGQKSLMTTEISYPPPTNIHLENINSSQITFAWDEVTIQCSSLRYVITAINCGVCPNTTTDKNVTCTIQSDLSLRTNDTCLFAVQTEICGHLLGERSDYVAVHIDDDVAVESLLDPPRFKLIFYYSSLKNTTVEIAFDDGAVLKDSSSLPISYTITYSDASSGRICDSAAIPASSCLNDLCCHTFGEISSSCSSNGYISITLFATTILGDGPPSQPLIFCLKHSGDEPDQGRGRHVTGELVLPVTAASLGAALVLVIAVFTMTIVKLQRDKESLRRLIESMAVQSSSGIIMKRSINRDYENIELCEQKAATKTVDIEIKENPAYSTVKDL